MPTFYVGLDHQTGGSYIPVIWQAYHRSIRLYKEEMPYGRDYVFIVEKY
jgi:hypothetical protein